MRASFMFLLAVAGLTATAQAGDISARLDTTNGASAFAVLNADTNPVLRVASDGAVLATGTVTAAGFVGNGAGLTNLDGAAIQANTVDSDQLAPNAVRSTHIAAGAVGSLQISNGAITSVDIAAGAITSNLLAAGAVSAVHLAQRYASGALDYQDWRVLSNSWFASYETNVVVTFSTPFAQTPVVTLTRQTSSRDLAAEPAPCLLSVDATQFTARVSFRSEEVIVTNTGYYSYDLCVVHGHPAIAYNGYDGGSLTPLYYRRALDPYGRSWGAPVAVSTDSVGNLSMTMVDGAPAIAATKNYGLDYYRATDTNGDTWGSAVRVDTNNYGDFCSLEVINGNPAIAYQYMVSSDLVYRRASNVVGSAWGTRYVVVTNGNSGNYNTLRMVNGNPAISYKNGSSNWLMFVRATGGYGTSWNAPVPVDTNLESGVFASMEIVNGYPAIAYLREQGSTGTLMFAHASDVDGTNWPAANLERVSAIDYPGGGANLEVINGYPTIGYCSVDKAQLCYVRSTSVSGSTWSEDPVVVLTNGFLYNPYCSVGLRQVEGTPAMVFMDFGNYDVFYLRAGNPPTNSYLNWIAVEP